MLKPFPLRGERELAHRVGRCPVWPRPTCALSPHATEVVAEARLHEGPLLSAEDMPEIRKASDLAIPATIPVPGDYMTFGFDALWLSPSSGPR